MVIDGDLDPSTYNKFAVQILSRENNLMLIEFVLKTAVYNTLNYILFENQKEQKELLFNLITEHLYNQHKELKNLFVEIMADILDSTNYEEIGYLLHCLTKQHEKLSLLRGESEILENFGNAKDYDLSKLSNVILLLILRKPNIKF